MKYSALSPDGIPIHRGDVYNSHEEAQKAIMEWKKRFAIQGHYRSSSGEKIGYSKIEERCTIVPVEKEVSDET